MERDIVLFYYYSSPSVPESCYLSLRPEIAYRNMFLHPCSGNKIHFEFPMFEDHSYNTICNLRGLRKLMQRANNNEKYIIFRTGNQHIVGLYKIRRAYYQETSMFNNNGFVWGIEANPYLIEKGLVKYEGPPPRQGFKASWHSDEWTEILNGLLLRIQEQENLSDIYKSETNRLIRLLKSKGATERWHRHCTACETQSECAIYPQIDRYNKEHTDSNMFITLYHVYNSNLYSRNALTAIPKIYLNIGGI